MVYGQDAAGVRRRCSPFVGEARQLKKRKREERAMKGYRRHPQG